MAQVQELPLPTKGLRVADVGVKAPPPVWKTFVGACGGSIIGCGLCHPFDVVKIRLQVQGEGMAGGAARGGAALGMGGMVKHIVRNEGLVGGFAYGLSSQVLRASTYYTMKIGMYDVIKKEVFGEKPGYNLPIEQKIASGLSAGGIAAALSNPCDLIMVRMLTDRTKPLEVRKNYGNAFGMLMKLHTSEWMVGFIPNVGRATIVTASQLVSYDQLKQFFLKHTPLTDAPPLHVTASFLAGVITGVTSNPVDVIKTRMMTDGGAYQGVVDCVVKTARNEGFHGFYKGCATTIARQCTYTIGAFVVMEQIKKLLNMFD
jgi:hypothetical protein